jgi:hypothetical protein
MEEQRKTHRRQIKKQNQHIKYDNYMPQQNSPKDTDTLIKERMAQLPKIVQDAITSADVQQHLRTLANGHKLHIDQWATLENEVMLALMGLSQVQDLAENIQNEVGVSAETAASLALDISQIVFEPIRQELERGLEHPEAKEKEVSATEAARTQILASEQTPTATVGSAINPMPPATPPAPAPTEKAVRAPVSASYTSRQPSTERKSATGDPYRELPQ